MAMLLRVGANAQMCRARWMSGEPRRRGEKILEEVALRMTGIAAALRTVEEGDFDPASSQERSG